MGLEHIAVLGDRGICFYMGYYENRHSEFGWRFFVYAPQSCMNWGAFVCGCATPMGSGVWEVCLLSAGSFASLRNTAVKYGLPSSRMCGVWEGILLSAGDPSASSGITLRLLLTCDLFEVFFV